MTEAQYDSIAGAYTLGIAQRVGRRFIFEPSLFGTIGEVRGLKVIDFGCGTGDLTRKLMKKGASCHGVDESEISVESAKSAACSIIAPYHQGNLATPDLFKAGDLKFLRGVGDLIVGGHIFHYSKSEEELKNMFQNAYDALKPEGRLVAINNSPENPLTEQTQYGEAARLVSPGMGLKNSVPIANTLYGPEGIICQFRTFHWDYLSYEYALKDAGFKDVKWTIPVVSKEGVDKFGKEFWEPWYANPFLAILEARK